jgi:hypothetical protein
VIPGVAACSGEGLPAPGAEGFESAGHDQSLVLVPH